MEDSSSSCISTCDELLPKYSVESFNSSTTPSRFLFFRNNTWVDFPPHIFNSLKNSFMKGSTSVSIPINGVPNLFDFSNMVQTDSVTGTQTSIAYIDVNGRCFSLNYNDSLKTLRFPKVEALKEEEKYYKVVEKLFLFGIRRVVPNSRVTSIYKCLHSGLSGSSRLKGFGMMSAMTKEARGDANVKFGWFGASKEGVGEVLEHGFGKSNDGGLGAAKHGVGIHLSPPQCPYRSSLLSEADDNGERHIILCRIIMGKCERVEAGSLQYHPSSEEFDSGMDDLVNPKWYIVWSTHMNTHILPEYVVSFKSSDQPQGPRREAISARRPLVAGISFSKLIAELERSLPSSRKQALEKLHNQHKTGKLAKDTFVRYLRSIAGDKVLASAIKRIRGY